MPRYKCHLSKMSRLRHKFHSPYRPTINCKWIKLMPTHKCGIKISFMHLLTLQRTILTKLTQKAFTYPWSSYVILNKHPIHGSLFLLAPLVPVAFSARAFDCFVFDGFALAFPLFFISSCISIPFDLLS